MSIRMMQRVAHRPDGSRSNPNQRRRNDRIQPRQVDRILGWFAVRLSERALTSFSLEGWSLAEAAATKSWKARSAAHS